MKVEATYLTDASREIWVESPAGRKLCALIHGDMGWLMYPEGQPPPFIDWRGDSGDDSSPFPLGKP